MENWYWPIDYTQAQAQAQTQTDDDDDDDDDDDEVPQFHHPSWDDRAASASRSHSEAEKRRRDRINAQLATLRKLIPMSEKMDKAALLGHVVDHVKEQRQRAKEASQSSTMPLPGEIDEVVIEQDESSGSNYVKASICCDDRPELFAELKSALKGLDATIVQAEVTTLGGRVKANFLISASAPNPLKMALTRLLISSAYTTRSKRQRFFYPTPTSPSPT